MSQRAVITIGNFDGVHLGHRAIVSRARAEASRLGTRLIAITFHPHPAALLRPGAAPPELTTIDQRATLLRQAGADEVRVIEPTRPVLAQSADEFLRRLVDEFRPAMLVEGADFRFGKDRQGDLAHLRRAESALGFTTLAVDAFRADLSDRWQVVVSSSIIRWLLGHGRVMDAARYLGREYAIAGAVSRGEQRGRTLGVPTANLDAQAMAGCALPGDGVYAGWAALPDGTRHAAAISVGVKPTFAGARRVIEAHLLHFSGHLYGQIITLGFSRWLRDQHPFPARDALVAQLRRDVAQTQAWWHAGLLGPAA